MAGKKAGFSKYMGLTFLIGFGFFTMGLMDTLYDTYLPDFLGRFFAEKTTIGTIMALDNLLAIFLIPVVTILSDRARTRLGRRMPFIVLLLPLSAISFAAIPYAVTSLAVLLVAVVILNVSKQSVRGPVVALMPDLTPAEFRSEANGVINMMGAIGGILSSLVLARFMKTRLPILGQVDNHLPFPIAGAMVAVAVILLLLFIRENKMAAAVGAPPEEKNEPFFESFRKVRKEGGSVILVLVSIFLWFLGYEGVKPFIGTYAIETLMQPKANAALGMGAVAIAMAVFAIPSGYIAHRIGRKKTIRIALMGLVVDTLLIFAFDAAFRNGLFGADPAQALKTAFPVYLGILFLFGIFWISVGANSFPMLWQMAKRDTMGIYTGVYYTFSQLAAIVAPPIAGLVIDVIRLLSQPGVPIRDIHPKVGYPGMFVFCSLCMLAAFFVMGGVKRGEADDKAGEGGAA